MDKETFRQVQAAYDAASSRYASRYWQAMWEANELPRMLGLVERYLPVRTHVLDLGTGTGLYRTWLEARGYRVTGVDLSWGMLQGALGNGQGPLVQSNAERLPFADGCAGGLVAARMLSHMPNARTAFNEWARVLTPGGVAFVSDVSHEHETTVVKMPVDGGSVTLPTWLRSDADIVLAAADAGFEHLESIRLDAHTMLQTPPEAIKFDRTGQRAVGVILAFVRR